jgi:predicted RNA-binding Zn ribbon-like protein
VPANVPPALWLVESFLNSVDVESGRDDLDTLPRFRRWLGDHGQAEAAATAIGADLALARLVRDELRAELLDRHDGGGHDRAGRDGADRAGRDGAGGDRSRLDMLASAIGLAVRFDTAAGPRLAAAEPGVRGVLGEVLAGVVRAAHEGTWARLKICSAGTCRYVYYDHSRNGSRRWCSMDVCGNRSKARAYRVRRRGGAAARA